MSIYNELIPTISFKERVYAFTNNEWPLVQLVKKFNYQGKILLTGEATIGKSTALRELKFHLLKQEIAYISIDLKNLNFANGQDVYNKEFFDEALNKISLQNRRMVFIIDSYEETSVYKGNRENKTSPREAADIIIEKCLKTDSMVIIACRNGSLSTKIKSKRRMGLQQWLSEVFPEILFVKINVLSAMQVHHCIGNDNLLINCSNDILKNTMFASIAKKIFVDSNVEGCKQLTEYSLIEKYFISLIRNKLSQRVWSENLNDEANRCYASSIREIGKNRFAYFTGEPDKNFELKNESIFTSIFYCVEQKETGNIIVDSSQSVFLSFCMAKYIYDELIPKVGSVSDKIIDKFNHYADQVAVGSFYMLGQMLTQSSGWFKDKKFIRRMLRRKDSYKNFGYMLLGASNDKVFDTKKYMYYYKNEFFKYFIEDNNFISTVRIGGIRNIRRNIFTCSSIENVIVGDDVTSISKYAFYGCQSLVSLHIGTNVKRIQQPTAFYNCKYLSKITVNSDNNKFYSENNCIIDKKDNKLVLACRYSVVPKFIGKIGSGAFCGCNIEDNPVEVPPDCIIDTSSKDAIFYKFRGGKRKVKTYYIGADCFLLYMHGRAFICSAGMYHRLLSKIGRFDDSLVSKREAKLKIRDMGYEYYKDSGESFLIIAKNNSNVVINEIFYFCFNYNDSWVDYQKYKLNIVHNDTYYNKLSSKLKEEYCLDHPEASKYFKWYERERTNSFKEGERGKLIKTIRQYLRALICFVSCWWLLVPYFKFYNAIKDWVWSFYSIYKIGMLLLILIGVFLFATVMDFIDLILAKLIAKKLIFYLDNKAILTLKDFQSWLKKEKNINMTFWYFI